MTRRGLSRAALNLLRFFVLVAAVATFPVLWVFNPEGYRLVFVVIPIAALATLPDVRRAFLPWAVYVVGFLTFVDLRMISAELLFPARYEYVIALERLLFFGTLPTYSLQERFYTLGQPAWWDLALMAVHFSFFLVPHAVAVWLWVRRRELFRPYVYALVGICWVGLLTAFLIPTAPPWLAAGAERIPHVYRIIRDVLMGASPETYVTGLRMVGENDAAAMPSLHTALTVLAALGAARMGPVAAVVGWTYVALMVLALVYLGEHYVVDAIAGAAVAVVGWRLATSGATHEIEPPIT